MSGCSDVTGPRPPAAASRCAALAGILALLLLVVLPAAPAAAHAGLIDSDPPDGATLPAAPTSARLRFDENIAPSGRTAQLVDGKGRPVPGPDLVPRPAGDSAMALDLPDLAPGGYGLRWSVVSDDGHDTSGVIVFFVGSGSTTRDLAAPAEQAGSAPARDVTLRWLGLSLICLAVGALAVLLLVLPRPGGYPADGVLHRAGLVATRRILTMAALAAGAASIVGVLGLPGQRRSTPGVALLDAVVTTRWGRLWAIGELALLALILLALRGRRANRTGRWWGLLVGGAALAPVVAEAMRSHAAVGPDQLRGIGVMTLHLLAACCWIGGLAALAVILSPQPEPRARAHLVRACRWPFSRLAALSVLIVVITGLYSAGREVTFVAGLTGSRYGLTLLAKVGLVALMCVLGAMNSARLHTPHLRGPARHLPSFTHVSRRSALTEFAVGLLVLLAAGLLLQTAPARGQAPAAAPVVSVARSRHAATLVDDLAVSVSAAPNVPGLNGFTVLAASSRRPPPARITGVSLVMDQGAGRATVEMRRVGTDEYFGTGMLQPDTGTAITTAVVLIRRGGQVLTARLPWPVDAAGPPAPPRSVPGGRLRPWTDGAALVLLLAAVAAAAAVATGSARRRGRRPPPPDQVPLPRPERVPEEIS